MPNYIVPNITKHLLSEINEKKIIRSNVKLNMIGNNCSIWVNNNVELTKQIGVVARQNKTRRYIVKFDTDQTAESDW